MKKEIKQSIPITKESRKKTIRLIDPLIKGQMDYFIIATIILLIIIVIGVMGWLLWSLLHPIPIKEIVRATI